MSQDPNYGSIQWLSGARIWDIINKVLKLEKKTLKRAKLPKLPE